MWKTPQASGGLSINVTNSRGRSPMSRYVTQMAFSTRLLLIAKIIGA